jgi:hypothetical protein
MRIEHSGGVKAMSDEQLEQGIEAIKAMLAARAGDDAKVIDAVLEPAALPKPKAKVSPKTRKSEADMGESMGSDGDVSDS